MEDFETFKAGRLRIDPSARNFNNRQWNEAYEAHRKSRQRVGQRADEHGPKKEASKRRKEVRRSGQKSASEDKHSRAFQSMHARSVYRDLRVLINALAWFAWAIIGLILIIKLLVYTSMPAVFLAFLSAALQVIAVFAFKILFKVGADAADFVREEDQSRRSTEVLGKERKID